nr:kinesin 1-like [Oryza sativa Japonica Group]
MVFAFGNNMWLDFSDKVFNAMEREVAGGGPGPPTISQYRPSQQTAAFIILNAWAAAVVVDRFAVARSHAVHRSSSPVSESGSGQRRAAGGRRSGGVGRLRRERGGHFPIPSRFADETLTGAHSPPPAAAHRSGTPQSSERFYLFPLTDGDDLGQSPSKSPSAMVASTQCRHMIDFANLVWLQVSDSFSPFPKLTQVGDRVLAYLQVSIRMSNVTVCVRFRPLSHKERKTNGDKVCFKRLDSESFVFKDEREEDVIFSFDRVFYEDAEQSDVYNFLAVPIVAGAMLCTNCLNCLDADAISGINGTIITYGQTGAGKTYSMEGPSILHCNKQKTGLVQRVVDELFQSLQSSESMAMWSVKLSMVEIYLEKVRDLLDLSKDNLQIKESKTQGIYISGATEVSIQNSSDALECLSEGIANRAVGETLQQGSTSDERVRGGKIILVDLAGSEKVEKTGAEGRVLDEAKTINKSLSVLGNVVNALTTGKPNHVPYRDSKLTRILQDALGGNSRAALLCCCSPSASNAPESLSTHLSRTKLIKTTPKSISPEVDSIKKPIPDSHGQNDLRDRILNKLRLSLKEEDVDLLEELFVQEGIIFDPNYSVADIDSACQDAASQEVSLLTQAVEELKETVEELTDENERLRGELELAQEAAAAAAAARADGALLGFVPAVAISSLLRPFGFVPD